MDKMRDTLIPDAGGARLVVLVNEGDAYGGEPGIEVTVETLDGGHRLPTRKELALHGQWIIRTVKELLPL